MKAKFSGAEVIQFAISLEEEGVKFYEKYAAMADDKLKGILLGMAEDERQHAKVFRDMYKDLEVNEYEEDYLFSDSVQEYFATHAKSEGFDRELKEVDTVRDAIKVAVETEKVTVEYYKSLLEYASEDVTKVLNRLIDEEERHQKRLEELL